MDSKTLEGKILTNCHCIADFFEGNFHHLSISIAIHENFLPYKKSTICM